MTGFDDLDEAGQQQESDDASNSPSVSDDELNTAESEPGSTGEIRNEPAFSFDDAIQGQIYPRRQTYDEWQDFLDIEVKRALRDRGIRNEAGRELHEASLKVLMNNAEEIADEVERLRTEQSSRR